MIRLFVSDVDGVVSEPFRPPPLAILSELVALHTQHDRDPTIPRFTLCTGRPKDYAEAIAQLLAVSTPILFESGSGMFDPVANALYWSEAISDSARATLAALRTEIQTNVVAAVPGTIAEFGKQLDVGLVNPDPARIPALKRMCEEHLARHAPHELEVHHTEVSVNIIPRAANKGAGVQWLAARLGLTLDEIAYIGDSSGDMSALGLVAMPFAPANATAGAKSLSTVTRGAATHGLIEAFHATIAHNRAVAQP